MRAGGALSVPRRVTVIVDRAVYVEGCRVHDAVSVKETIKGHQRSKLEGYGDDRALMVRAARYIESTETVGFGDIHLFVTPNPVESVRLAEEPDLGAVRARLEAEPRLLAPSLVGTIYGMNFHHVPELAWV